MLPSNSKLCIDETQLNSILSALDSCLLITQTEHDRIVYANRSARELLCADTPAAQFWKKDLYARFPGLQAAFTDSSPASLEVQSADGHLFACSVTGVEWIDHQPANMILLRNIDEEAANRSKLQSLAYYDPLTGLPNRRKLREDMEAAAGRSGVSAAIALFDLDNFKSVNDTYGHNTGDILMKRIVEHLQSDPSFDGHLYRLGGDEFILYYSDQNSRNYTEAAYRTYYLELLQNALRAYTMPIIDVSCTLSIGVAFAPTHGTSHSELLRKADIALYQSKESGRNRITVFEDWYEKAKKFNDYYIDIRPILSGFERTFGYELADSTCGEDDTGDTVNLGQFEYNRAIDALSPGDLDKGACYFIRYHRQLGSKMVQNNLPKEQFIVMMDARSGDKNTKPYRALRDQGYRLAVSGLGDGNLSPELVKIADFVRFGENASSLLKKRMLQKFPGKTFIATGVHTTAAYESAKAQGFTLFQGQFFNQPVVLRKEKDIEPLKANYCRLLELTSTGDYVDFREIADIISLDMALSYKLLRMLNTVAMGFRYRITSISMALSYLGEDVLKRWIALLALRGVAADKPLELVRISLIRARFGEILAPCVLPDCPPKQVFFTGILSLLHVALDQPKETLFRDISLDADIRESLLTEHGVYSELLAFFRNYEYSNWEYVTAFTQKNQLENDVVFQAYISAVKWYNDLTSTV